MDNIMCYWESNYNLSISEIDVYFLKSILKRASF